MRLKIFALVISFTSIFFSCKEVTEPDPVTENPELDTKNSTGFENEIPKVEQDSLIRELQGNWRETEYPFRMAEFKESRVKFIEEGIVEEPRFQEYKITGSCPFMVNNIKIMGPEDLILALIENKRCEKLKVTNDTLTLSGFNANTGTEYHIVYRRAD